MFNPQVSPNHWALRLLSRPTPLAILTFARSAQIWWAGLLASSAGSEHRLRRHPIIAHRTGVGQIKRRSSSGWVATNGKQQCCLSQSLVMTAASHAEASLDIGGGAGQDTGDCKSVLRHHHHHHHHPLTTTLWQLYYCSQYQSQTNSYFLTDAEKKSESKSSKVEGNKLEGSVCFLEWESIWSVFFGGGGSQVFPHWLFVFFSPHFDSMKIDAKWQSGIWPFMVVIDRILKVQMYGSH